MYGAELKEDCTSVCLWVLDREGPEGDEREGVDGYREAWMNGKKKDSGRSSKEWDYDRRCAGACFVANTQWV
jgi:hypothetical protein